MKKLLDCYERRITDFIEKKMVDPDGIIYDKINSDTLRPFTIKECTPLLTLDPDINKVNAPEPFRITFHNYEDSDMATADYLTSQIYRYFVTGENQACLIVRRCYDALKSIANEGAKYEAGFLPKPYGGIKGASLSRESSPDQYSKVILALDFLRMTTSDCLLKKEAVELILSFAESWDRHNCSHIYFGKLTHWVEGSHALAFLLYLMRLSYHLSRRRVFLRWYELLFEKRKWLFMRPYASGNMNSMIARSMSRLIELVPSQRGLWLRAIRHNWRLADGRIHPLGYLIPNPSSEAFSLNGKTPFHLYGESTQLASAAVFVSQALGIHSPLKCAKEILEKTGKEGIVYYTKILDEKKVAPYLNVIRKSISGYYMAGWVLAYWQLRWLEAGKITRKITL